MALTTHHWLERRPALRTLKTKWDVPRKQALKHMGQLVTLCYCCCKAASTRLQHMLLRSATTRPLLCLLRSGRSAATHHVGVKAIWRVVAPMTRRNHCPVVRDSVSMLSVTLLHFKEAQSSFCRLRSAQVGHNVGQCACLHKLLYSEKKGFRAHVVGQTTTGKKCFVLQRPEKKNIFCDFPPVFRCQGSYTTLYLLHLFLRLHVG